MAKEIKDGKEIDTKNSGHVVTIPEQTGTVSEPPAIDMATLTELQFRTLVLERLGYKTE